MGFALWMDREVAWAEGTYEYRALGAAVIASTDLFRAADFRQNRQAPDVSDASFIGYFASLGDLNEFLRRNRRAR